jgi:hypothetical protein
MSNQNQHKNRIPFVRELCKHKTEAEIQEAEENSRNYLLLVKRICERLESEEDSRTSLDSGDNYEII